MYNDTGIACVMALLTRDDDVDDDDGDVDGDFFIKCDSLLILKDGDSNNNNATR